MVGEIASMSGGLPHPDMFSALAESIPKSSAHMGVVCRHCIATVMLCHATSPFHTAGSTVELSSPRSDWRGHINRMV
ncbi:MAG: hypothetical protein QOC69_6148 [Mycobacterium sp.]|nr:hypothetical protein [Mycobacterium sp.]